MSVGTIRRFHLCFIALWCLLIVPTVFVWSDSILWVAFMSIYACIGYHVQGYQAARVEKKQGEAE